MADEGIVDKYAPSGWDVLRQLFIDNGLSELANTITESVQKNLGNDALVYEDLRKSQPYKDRFAGNFARLANGKNFLSERAYLEQENMYAEVMTPYGASALATRDNYAKFIANDVSVNELNDRFTLAYERVTKAVNADDKALVDELKKMYPGVTDNELATSLLLGKEGSKFLNTKINVAEIKAAETESGIQSTFGAERLAAEGLNRSQARIGLSRVAAAKGGLEQASQIFGESNAEGIQQELESENLLGIQSKRTKRLASQQRGQYSGQSGIKTGSLGRKTQV
jgi:hypothetical protein